MKTLRIFLFILIIIGVVLLCSQNIWVTPLVNKILASEDGSPQPIVTQTSQPKITVSPSKTVAPTRAGTFTGKATIVATVTQDCHETAKPENSGLKIYQKNQLIKSFNFNPDGTYKISLAPGTYMVYGNNESPGSETHPDMWASVLPKQIVITSGGVTTLNLSTSYICNAL